jgi:DNA-binding NarL/FixJ family response regulator
MRSIAMPDRIEIVIADDHPLFRSGLRHAVEKVAGFVVVDEAGDGKAALECIREHKPAVVVLDLDMPVMNGLDAAKQIVRERLPVAIIILTMYDDEEMFNEAMDIGVLGYVLKDSASVDIVRGIAAVARGEYFVSPSLAGIALRARQTGNVSVESRLGLLNLTPTERRILKLVAEDRTSAEIADALGISARTVDNHRTNICHKLGLNGNNALLRYALTHRSHL